MYYSLNANVHRGVHFLSQEATNAHESARVTVQKFIGAKSPNEIVFTHGATESINLVASCFCRAFCKEGDEILITAMEHHSNIVPWQLQGDIMGIKLQVVPINENGELRLDELEKKSSSRTTLIALTHISNVLGTINPIEKITKIAHDRNIPVLVDAAQSVQHSRLMYNWSIAIFWFFHPIRFTDLPGLASCMGKKSGWMPCLLIRVAAK